MFYANGLLRAVHDWIAHQNNPKRQPGRPFSICKPKREPFSMGSIPNTPRLTLKAYMLTDEFLEHVDSTLRPLGGRKSEGLAFEQPPLVIEQAHWRQVRTSWLPWLGLTQSITLVVQQPSDLPFHESGMRQFWERLSLVASAQATLRKGPGIALTAIQLTSDRLEPNDSAMLERTLQPVARQRAIPLGVFRVNLQQGIFSYAIRRGPGGLFPEPELLADEFCKHLGQFVPLLDTNAVL